MTAKAISEMTPRELVEHSQALLERITKYPWRDSGRDYVVAPDAPLGHQNPDHYGGQALVAESLFSGHDRRFVAEAPELIARLCTLVEHREWVP